MLSPLLWTVMYNEVIVLFTLEEATIFALADDLVAVVTEEQSEDVEVYATVIYWLKRDRLFLGDGKMDVVFIMKKERGTHSRSSSRIYDCLKTGAVMICPKLNFRERQENVLQRVLLPKVGESN